MTLALRSTKFPFKIITVFCCTNSIAIGSIDQLGNKNKKILVTKVNYIIMKENEIAIALAIASCTNTTKTVLNSFSEYS